MPWVEFTEDHDFTPAENRQVTLAYKAGMRMNVVRECADQAVKLGRARRIKTPTAEEAARLRAPEGQGDGVG